MSSTETKLNLKFVSYPNIFEPSEKTAATELAKITSATLNLGNSGVHVSLATRGIPQNLPTKAKDSKAWMWIRIADDGSGEICATHGSFLFAAVRLLATNLNDFTREKLAIGLWLPASFSWHRTHWDACYAQYWRSARDFNQEHYVATLAEAGFTHCEVNSLEANMPLEDSVAHEYYSQFYTYCPGFNHFVDTPLTQGIWPAHYLDANLNNLKHLADLGRKYGLKPGVCMFEPRTLPERFFAKYPTLRGARVDHPFRSHLPRYTMAQDHPIVQKHYREALKKVMMAVPDLSYMSVWTNDSGAGFEHTASLYVGRNGGPYMIREWRSHDKVAQAAGESIVRYLKNLQSAAAEINPKFDVILRIEPFKVEHEHIKKGMGDHITWEAPSLLVRGYHLPYSHPKYPENQAVAGSVFHTTMDNSEKETLIQSRAAGVDPIIHYSGSSVMNHEPLLGIPYPRLLHAKLTAMRETGINRISCLGGLTSTSKTPYWPNPHIINAAQFFPNKNVEDVLYDYASSLVGVEHAKNLSSLWDEFEQALSWQPVVMLYCAFGFCWQRTWDRPFVPDIEAVPSIDRQYYEKHGCFQLNNPGINDLGKDVLFDLINQENGGKMAADIDKEVISRLVPLITKLDLQLKVLKGEPYKVHKDLRDRIRIYLHWVTSLRSVCAWCECVYGYLAAKDTETKTTFNNRLQLAIDIELSNVRGLIELLENTSSELIVMSGTSENTFLYGENLVEHLKVKLHLTEKYRHNNPRIDRNIYWRATPGTQWPAGWTASNTQ